MATQKGYRYDPAAAYPLREHDVEYLRVAGETRQVRIYQPQGEGPFPVLLSVHGGAWSGGDHTNNSTTSRPLAATGWVVAAIGLRVAPQFSYPIQVQDTNYAIRWLKAHAGDFNGDPDTLGGIGYSSGGHTLFLSALRPNDPRYSTLPLADPTAVDANLGWMVGCWPVIDPYARHVFAEKSGNERLSGLSSGYFLGEDAMHDGNPQEMLDRGEKAALPPALIIHGTADNNVPIEISQRFVTSYQAAGGQIHLETFDGMAHGFGNQEGPETDRLLQLVKEFIAKQL